MKTLSALVLGLFAVLPAGAQTLADALESALARHPVAMSAVPRAEAADALVEAAASLTPRPLSASLAA